MSGCAQTDVAGYENCGAPAQGLLAYGAIGNGSLQNWLTAAVNSSKPAGANSTYGPHCEAMLRARGLIYYKSSPGDCGKPSAIPGISSGQIAGLSGTAASGVAGGLGVAGVIGGAATLGITSAISVAVAGIESIFAHHDQAVANEQATICSVVNYFNPIMAQLDAAVRAGTISPAQGITYLQQVANQAISGLAGIEKQCNAACFYKGFLNAHVYFAKNYYPFISPEQAAAAAPGAPPSSTGTPPGGVTLSGSNVAPPPPVRSVSTVEQTAAGVSLQQQAPVTIQNPNSGQAAQIAPEAPSTFNWTALAAIVAVVTLLVILARG